VKQRQPTTKWVLLTLLSGCSVDAALPEAPPSPRQPAAPELRYDFGCPNDAELACTGLYGEYGIYWRSKRLGAGVEPFSPAMALWSDHTHKQRFVWLPPGTKIDTSAPDDWSFPVGTRFWKEFSYAVRRIETRYLHKLGPQQWRAATFRWTDDETHAVALYAGERNVPGTFQDSYEIPRAEQCQRCHNGATDQILGFSAILLGQSDAKGLTVARLEKQGLLSQPLPPLQLPGDSRERAALLHLHVNCGVACHNPKFGSEAWWTGFHLKLEVGQLASPGETATYRTGVGLESYIPREDGSGYMPLIAPGQPDESAVFYRDGQRDNALQMPPLGTHVIDEAGLTVLRDWIVALP